MNSTLTHLYLSLGEFWYLTSPTVGEGFGTVRCNNSIDDEGAIRLAAALETGCSSANWLVGRGHPQRRWSLSRGRQARNSDKAARESYEPFRKRFIGERLAWPLPAQIISIYAFWMHLDLLPPGRGVVFDANVAWSTNLWRLESSQVRIDAPALPSTQTSWKQLVDMLLQKYVSVHATPYYCWYFWALGACKFSLGE